LIEILLNLSRKNKRILMITGDFFIILLSLVVAFYIRIWNLFIPDFNDLILILLSPFLGIALLYSFGVYKILIKYITIGFFLKIFYAVLFQGLLWFFIASYQIDNSILGPTFFIHIILTPLLLVVARVLAYQILYSDNNGGLIPVMIFGAEKQSISLSNSIEHSEKYSLRGFISVSSDIVGSEIKGCKVYSYKNIKKIISKFKIKQIFFTDSFFSSEEKLNFYKEMESINVNVKILPSFDELDNHEYDISSFRDIQIEDILERGEVKHNEDLFLKNIKNKIVMVSGAGGSIGSELCRQIFIRKPKKLICLDINELSLYNLEKEFSSKFNDLSNIYFVIGNSQNKNRMIKLLERYKVNTIYHAAAYKHVPMVEFNSIEGLENNFIGTLNFAESAIEASVETFVMISTDKAVRPTNTMGATKRLAEIAVENLYATTKTKTCFSIVRFGNVLNSSGSVIPLFRSQIQAGGPVTVTDKNMRRYFMSIKEAVGLVIQAGAMSKGCEIFILDMGKAMSIDQLARKMIKLSGKSIRDSNNQNGDIEIKYTGIRPGEKLFEELLVDGKAENTNHPLIFRSKEDFSQFRSFKETILNFKEAIELNDSTLVRRLLIENVDGFKPQSKPLDLLS